MLGTLFKAEAAEDSLFANDHVLFSYMFYTVPRLFWIRVVDVGASDFSRDLWSRCLNRPLLSTLISLKTPNVCSNNLCSTAPYSHSQNSYKTWKYQSYYVLKRPRPLSLKAVQLSVSQRCKTLTGKFHIGNSGLVQVDGEKVKLNKMWTSSTSMDFNWFTWAITGSITS